MRWTNRVFTIVAAMVSTLCAGAAAAQSYPTRPIKFVVATSPGATADLLARVFAEPMAKELNQPIVIENRAGADQIIALEYIAKSAPADGYTVGVIGYDGQALLPLVKQSLRFDPINDLTPVAKLGEVRYVLAGPVSAPYRGFKELIDAAKAQPGKFNYGSSTPAVRFPTLVLMQELGLDMVHVPFAGGGPMFTALLSATIDWAIIGEGSANSLKPRVRLYAITGATRSTANPEVPTFAEFGFGKISGPAYGLMVRPGTPQAIVDRLSSATATVLNTPEMKAGAQKMVVDLHYLKADGIARDLAERFKTYQDVLRKVDLKRE